MYRGFFLSGWDIHLNVADRSRARYGIRPKYCSNDIGYVEYRSRAVALIARHYYWD